MIGLGSSKKLILWVVRKYSAKKTEAKLLPSKVKKKLPFIFSM